MEVAAEEAEEAVRGGEAVEEEVVEEAPQAGHNPSQARSVGRSQSGTKLGLMRTSQACLKL